MECRRAAVVAWDESRAIITGGMNNTMKQETLFSSTTRIPWRLKLFPQCFRQGAGHAAVIVGGNLFVIGGYGPNGISLNSIEVLDLNDPREWKTVSSQFGNSTM